MARLGVTVRLHGTVVDEGTFEVRKRLSFGEARRARIPFPGAEVHAELRGDGIWVRGVELKAGDQLRIGVGDLDIDLQHIPPPGPAPAFRSPWAGFDRRFGASVLVVLMCGLWIDTVDSQFASSAQVEVQSGEGSLLEPSNEEQRSAEASLSMPEDLDVSSPSSPISGEVHRADDHRTGLRWSEWASREWAGQTVADVGGSRSKWLYQQGALEEALALLPKGVLDSETVRLRARSLVRLGRYGDAQAELLEYTRARPQDAIAQLQLRTIMARLGQPDSPERASRSERAPWHEVRLAEALMASASERNDEALMIVDALFKQWEEIDSDGQGEVRVAIATDPLFASLRGHPGLISMLYRHLGAAAPGRLR